MTIKNLKTSKYGILYFYLCLSIGFAFLLLAYRIQLTHSKFYLFLVWNLFLAGIPFAISQTLKMNTKLSSLKIVGFISFFVWLLFLPNSPYIITDLVHLHSKHSNLLWLDLFLVFVFAFNGLLLGVRFNSWDITTKPITLFYEIAQSLREPKVWLITFAFGGFLWLLFSVLQSVLQMREQPTITLKNKS